MDGNYHQYPISNPRIDFGPLNEITKKEAKNERIDSGLKNKFPIGRFFYDSNSKSIYSMGGDDGKLMRGKVTTNNHSIEWSKIGTTKTTWDNHRKIFIFNNTNIYFVPSQRMEAASYAARAVRKCQIMNFNLKQNKFVKAIDYSAFTNGRILEQCHQINNESLFAQEYDVGCLINPKEKDDKLRYSKLVINNYDKYKCLLEIEDSYDTGLSLGIGWVNTDRNQTAIVGIMDNNNETLFFLSKSDEILSLTNNNSYFGAIYFWWSYNDSTETNYFESQNVNISGCDWR